MSPSMKKTLDYRHFLFGIVVYWLFEAVWGICDLIFFDLERLMNPIAVVLGKYILFIGLFYAFFRTPKMLNIRWIHIVVLIVLRVIVVLLNYFLIEYFHNHATYYYIDNDLIKNAIRYINKWVDFITDLLIIGFLWWRYKSAETYSGTDTAAGEARGYYGGMLFCITFASITCLVRTIGEKYWGFVTYPIIEEIVTCLLLVFVTVGAVALLVKKRLVVIPVIGLLAISALLLFSKYYLFGILQEHFTENNVYMQQDPYFLIANGICSWAFFLTAFVLYRKTMCRAVPWDGSTTD